MVHVNSQQGINVATNMLNTLSCRTIHLLQKSNLIKLEIYFAYITYILNLVETKNLFQKTKHIFKSPLVWCLSLSLLSMSFCLCGGEYMYSRQELIDIGLRCSMDITSDFQRSHNIPDYIARPAESPWVCFPSRRRRRRRERKQKRGCRAGFRARLKRNPHKPPLPSIYMTNARSVMHKMDELELLTASDHFVRTCCIMIITESWLQPLIPDNATQLA